MEYTMSINRSVLSDYQFFAILDYINSCEQLGITEEGYLFDEFSCLDLWYFKVNDGILVMSCYDGSKDKRLINSMEKLLLKLEVTNKIFMYLVW